ncbi:MAG: hypothetical protein AABX13_05830 [Nanoarchaeota archaeon]
MATIPRTTTPSATTPRTVPSDALIRRTVDVAEQITALTQWHEEYLSGQRVPLLPPANEVREELEAIVGDSSFGYDQRVAQAAAFISAGIVGSVYDKERLPYFGKAIVLAIESERGRTNEVAFQDVVRYLLAKNGYTPIKTEQYGQHTTYHFYTDRPGTKVVAISERGINVHCAELKSEFGLDELVNDFLNLKRGKNQKLVEYETERKANSGFFRSLGGVAGLLGGGLLGSTSFFFEKSGSGLLTTFFILGPLGAYSGYKLSKFAYAKLTEGRYQRKLQQERVNFPYTPLTSGVYALIDAFPLPENPVVEGKLVEKK